MMGTGSVEYQAVVLAAGKGSRMTDVTSSKAKCMLPIGGFPMLWYSLASLRKIGFKEVIVVALESSKAEILALPKKYHLDLALDVVTYQPDHEYDSGTADAIRLVHPKIVANKIMVISGDLITDFAIHHLTDLHGLHNASVTALYAKNKGRNPKSITVPGPKTKFKREAKNFVVLDKTTNQLCYLASEADLDEVLAVKTNVLREHSQVSMHTNLMDAHMYIFDKWVCDFIKEDE